MIIKQIYSHNKLGNFSYLVMGNNSDAYCIDPVSAPDILSILSPLGGNLKAIFTTHDHFDHVMGNEKIIEKTQAKIYCHESALSKVAGATRAVSDGEIIKIDDEHVFQVMDTPGHTFTHISLLLKRGDDPIALFSGDTLFNAGVGNCRNGGDPKTLYKTITQQFATLPGEVQVYPGHYYLETNLNFYLSIDPDQLACKKMLDECQSRAKGGVEGECKGECIVNTIEDEKKINPFMRLDDPVIVKYIEKEFKISNPDHQEVFIRLRELRNRW